MKSRTWLLWLVAVVVAAGLSVYQRMAGPTSPLHGKVDVGGTDVKYRLKRSFPNDKDGEIRLTVPDKAISGTLDFRRHPIDDKMTERVMTRDGDDLVGVIPKQPAAGKVMYIITLSKDEKAVVPLTAEPVIVRFKNPEPLFATIPHVVALILAMLLNVRTALEAIAGRPKILAFALATIVALVLGGFVFGPLMQKYAFGAYWTGWPLGHDLTDNKMAVALLLWLVALWRIAVKPPSRGWAVAAALVMIGMWLIPHSVLGSELDYTKVPQG